MLKDQNNKGPIAEDAPTGFQGESGGLECSTTSILPQLFSRITNLRQRPHSFVWCCSDGFKRARASGASQHAVEMMTEPTLPLCPSTKVIFGTFRDARPTCATSDTLLNGAYDFATDHNIFMDTPLAGAAALFVSFGCLTMCLVFLVKLLELILKGLVAIWMRFVLNLEFRIPEIGNHVIILFGCAITILVQSSSVTTSTLTLLVALGLLRLDKMFPFTVGANAGTIVTEILSASAPSNIKDGTTLALAHLFFNLFGALIWFPLPFPRGCPNFDVKVLGLCGS